MLDSIHFPAALVGGFCLFFTVATFTFMKHEIGGKDDLLFLWALAAATVFLDERPISVAMCLFCVCIVRISVIPLRQSKADKPFTNPISFFLQEACLEFAVACVALSMLFLFYSSDDAYDANNGSIFPNAKDERISAIVTSIMMLIPLLILLFLNPLKALFDILFIREEAAQATHTRSTLVRWETLQVEIIIHVF